MIVPFDADTVKQIVPEQTTSLCLMGSFLAYPTIPTNLLEYMRQLSRHFDRMVFITNDCHGGHLTNQDKLPESCVVVFVKNEGLDLGMVYKVLANLQKNNLRRICHVNDSCWVVNDLDNAFARAKRNNFKFWGLLKSFEVRPHIQSFFVVAEDEAIDHYLDFYRNAEMESNISRHDIIHKFEIGLSEHMSHKFDLDSHYSMESVLRVAPERPLPPNASVNYWDVLLMLGFPLLKRNRTNFIGSVDVMHVYIDPYFLNTIR